MTVEYQRRLEKHYDELKWLYCELYPNGQGRFEELCAAMEQWYKERNKKMESAGSEKRKTERLVQEPENARYDAVHRRIRR